MAEHRRLDDDVVTGGTHGIGRAVTGAFATRGETVVAGYHSNEEAAAETADALADASGDVSTRQFDVREYDDVSSNVDDVEQAHGPITALVNNAGRDIRVNAVAPGLVDTAQYQELCEGGFDNTGQSDIPQDRVAEPGEVAECVVFLASDRASYVTGEPLRVAGGQLS